MEGFIDSISENRLVIEGWVKWPGNPNPDLKLRVGDELIGSSILFPASGNVLKLKGVQARTFRIRLSMPLGIFDGLSETFQVEAIPGPFGVPIRPTAGFIAKERENILKSFRGLSRENRNQVLGSLGALLPVEPKILDQKEVDLSPVLFPVGLLSGKKDAVLGESGYLFLIEGTNRVAQRYDSPKSEKSKEKFEREVSEWRALIENRSQLAADLRIRFLQVVLPDKLTAMRKFSPISISGPTPTLAALVDHFDSSKYFLDTLPTFDNWNLRTSPWLRTDSHFSSAAAAVIALRITSAFGFDEEFFPLDQFTSHRNRHGDLGKRFFGVQMWEESDEPSFDSNIFDDSEIRVEELRKTFKSGASLDIGSPTGIHLKFVNRNAPIDQKLMVFGTSTSGIGNDPINLSWWFKRLFKEYHIVWSSEIEWDLVEKVQPDFLVSQTVERHLSRTPRS